MDKGQVLSVLHKLSLFHGPGKCPQILYDILPLPGQTKLRLHLLPPYKDPGKKRYAALPLLPQHMGQIKVGILPYHGSHLGRCGHSLVLAFLSSGQIVIEKRLLVRTQPLVRISLETGTRAAVDKAVLNLKLHLIDHTAVPDLAGDSHLTFPERLCLHRGNFHPFSPLTILAAVLSASDHYIRSGASNPRRSMQVSKTPLVRPISPI